MEEQDSILNEFLERIKAKEKSNEELRQKIVKKKEELTKINIELTKPINPESNKIIISKKLFSEKEGEIASQKALYNYNSLKYSKSDINDNCIERIIEYITTEQISNLYIMGDFTKCEPFKFISFSLDEVNGIFLSSFLPIISNPSNGVISNNALLSFISSYNSSFSLIISLSL